MGLWDDELMTAPQPVTGQVNSDRIAALEYAADYIDRVKIFDVPRKPNGYAEDGWKPFTIQEKTAMVLRIAHWVMTGEGAPPT